MVGHRLKGRWNSDNGGVRQQDTHFLRTLIPRACKAVMHQLFDVCIMLEDSVFRGPLHSLHGTI